MFWSGLVSLLLLCAVATVSAQYSNGAFIATSSPAGNLVAWNAESNSSISDVCEFGRTIFSPAYTVDASTRTFYYLYRFFGLSRLASWEFGMNSSNDTLMCGAEKNFCEEQWFTNSTAAIFFDVGLQQFVMIDTYLTPTSHDEYICRTWVFDSTSCQLSLVDEFEGAPYLLRTVDSFAYDQNNHRLYFMYVPQTASEKLQFRMRAVDVKGRQVAYDIFGPSLQQLEFTPYMQFDPSSGSIVMLVENVYKDYNLTFVNPITPSFDITNYGVPKKWAPKATTDMVIDWRQRLLVTQRPQPDSTFFEQHSLFLANGTLYKSFEFDTYVDYGWQYDPVVTVSVTNINTASENQLMNIPEVTGSVAANIVKYRTVSGAFRNVEQLLSVQGVSQSAFLSMRPYTCI